MEIRDLFYGREGVAPACLLLQDRLAVNVNILLSQFSPCSRRGVSLSSDDLSAAAASSTIGIGRSSEAPSSSAQALEIGTEPRPFPRDGRAT